MPTAPRAEESPCPGPRSSRASSPPSRRSSTASRSRPWRTTTSSTRATCKKTNECRKILKEFDYDEVEGNQVFSQLRAVSVDYTFALLGFKNHELYFGHLGGAGGEPEGRFAELVGEEFPGGVEAWKQSVRKSASAARGWVMVGYDLNDGSIFNYIMDTQNLWAVYNMVPVLALDVYEHAYARDFGATPDGRKSYVDAFFANLDWDHVNGQLAQAEAARQAASQAGG